jgi:hypothetical protein
VSGPPPLPAAGLCAACRWAAVHASARATYLRCRRAETDPAYPRYPRLPVLACAGYEPGARDEPELERRAK